jgi:HK97 family phage major capsid protein
MSDITLKKEELAQLIDEASAKAVEVALAKKVDELGLGKTTKKFAYKGQIDNLTEAEIKSLDKKEKMASFIKAVFHKDSASLATFKAMSEGTDSAGGFVVPEEFAGEVNRIVEDFGLIAKLARKFPMKSDTLNVPRLSASVTVSYPGEATAGTASQPTFERVQLLSKTLVGLTPMSNELLEDADISVVDLLTELFAEAIAGEMDKQGLAGTGSPFTGILTDSGVTVVTGASGDTTFTACATPSYARQLISQVKPWALQGASFVMHRTVWSLMQTVRTISASSGDYFSASYNPVVVGSSQVQGFPTAMAGTLWGYPVYLSDKMPTTTAVTTKFIIFGSLKNVYVGMRKDLNISISQEGTIGGVSLFETNQSAIRVTARHAIAVGLPTAFAVLKTATS